MNQEKEYIVTSPQGEFKGAIIVHPTVDLQLPLRGVGKFTIRSTGPGRLEATSAHADAWRLFIGEFKTDLVRLSWDMVWERLVAVQFEPDSGHRDEVNSEGGQIRMMYLHDTIDAGAGNPKHGIPRWHSSTIIRSKKSGGYSR